MSVDHRSNAAALEWEVLQPEATTRTWVALARETRECPHASPAAEANAVQLVYERALRALPQSYKLWTLYIAYRRERTRALAPAAEWFSGVRALYERALACLPAMPLLWASFLDFVLDAPPPPRVGMVRHLVGRALAALPATQHHHVWRRVRRWGRGPAAPVETVVLLWRAQLLLEPSAARERELLALLFERGAHDAYVGELLRLADAEAAGGAGAAGVAAVLRSGDALVWERLGAALLAPGWRFDGCWARLRALVERGRPYALSQVSLPLALAAFAYGQGRPAEGRADLARLLDSAPDPESFRVVYAAAAALEDQLVDAFVAGGGVARGEGGERLARRVFGAPDALAPLRELQDGFALWQNQAALRFAPHNTLLWCKRIELVRARVAAGAQPPADLFALCEQAEAQCARGMRRVECAAGQLFETHAALLVAAGRPERALQVLEDGGWRTPFRSPLTNALLIGMWAEVALLTCAGSPQLRALCEDVVQRLSPPAPAPAASGLLKRSRGGLLTRAGTAASVRACGAVWLLAVDVALGCGASDDCLARLLALFRGHSGCYTAEAAAHVARACAAAGRREAALLELEHAAQTFRDDAQPFLFIASQCASFLMATPPSPDSTAAPPPLERLRELCAVALARAPRWAREAPCALSDFLTACAAVECGYGLLTTAADTAQRLAAALARRASPITHGALAAAALERALRLTAACGGVAAVRTWCAALLPRLSSPALIARAALAWAALERRAGNAGGAATVLEACAGTQSPSSPHGRAFWEAWALLCVDDEAAFAAVTRRRKQVEIALAEKSAHA